MTLLAIFIALIFLLSFAGGYLERTVVTAPMHSAVSGSIKALEAFTRYVSPPVTNETVTSTNPHPFNVLDYGTAAQEVGMAAKDLQALLTTVNQSAPEVTRITQSTTAEAKRVVNQAFRAGLALILVFLAGAVLAGLAYRGLSNKLMPVGPKLGSRAEPGQRNNRTDSSSTPDT